MNMIEAVYTYYYNPFKYAKTISSFYSSLDNIDNNILLLPLVIPICSHPELSKKLSRVIIKGKNKSSFYTKFGRHKYFYDLQERIDTLKKVSKQSLTLCLVNDWLFLDDKNLNIISNHTQSSKDGDKEAKNLAYLFSGLSVEDIYRGLRVHP